MALKVARRASIDPFIAMDVLRQANERQAAGADIVHLEVGQPGSPAPAKVVEAAERALRQERIGYTDALGLPPLREAIARHYKGFYGLDVPSQNVIVTTGSSGAFLVAFLAAFDPGDRVLLAGPSYPCYRNILSALGIRPIIAQMQAESKFQLTEQALVAADGSIDGVIIASPSNPVGAIIGVDSLRAIVQTCRARGARLISDEIYHGIAFGAEAQSVAGISGDAIVINSFSKYFCMTGWRLGWMIAPNDLLRPIERLAQNLFISPPALSQWAAIAAFDSHDELRANVRRYAANRDILLNELPKAGFDELIQPDGAFYFYVNVSRLTNDSTAFCQRMLVEAGVAATPGADFDAERGNQWLRFSFAGAGAEIVEAVRRLRDWRK